MIGIDGLDELSSEDAALALQTARSLLAMPGIVTVVAADRSHLANGLAENDPALATARLARLIQIPYTLGGPQEDWPDAGPFARSLLEADPRSEAADETSPPDAATSALDRPWSTAEVAVVEALAPRAGATPRAVKRFVNLYRIARADPQMRGGSAKDLAALALALALQSAGSPADPREPPYDGMSDDVEAARNAASVALGSRIDAKDGARGYQTAQVYTAIR